MNTHHHPALAAISRLAAGEWLALLLNSQTCPKQLTHCVQCFQTQAHPQAALYLVWLDDSQPPFAAFRQPEALPQPFAPALWPTLKQMAASFSPGVLNVCPDLWPRVQLWVADAQAAAELPADLQGRLFDAEPEQALVTTIRPPAHHPKPWFTPTPSDPAEQVIVVGAGIAGASTAHALARRGIAVTVLEQAAAPALAASGNRQGLIYAKISPHPTEQTRLLLSGYGFSLRLLAQSLPEQTAWQNCGVLHLDHQPQEARRNRLLAAQGHPLYHAVTAAEASALAGIPLTEGGLFWPQGAWVHPPTWIAALLDHPHIRVHHLCSVTALQHGDAAWHVRCSNGQTFSGSHLVLCQGADSGRLSPLDTLPFRRIRGQTDVAAASPFSSRLNIALSGASYISPAWQGQHCFGASFVFDDPQTDWRLHECRDNWQALARLQPQLAHSLTAPDFRLPETIPCGHAALRCDSSDHLPVVGALGDATAMRQTYAKLALDKHYRLTDPCPYWPNLYLNTAHGTRGLSTAPLCGEVIAAQIASQPCPFPETIRTALHPNRLIIRPIIQGRL